MSNGTPDPTEGGPAEPPGLIVFLSVAYILVCIAGAVAMLVFGWSPFGTQTWAVAFALVLLAGAVAVVAREIGFFGARGKPK